MRRPAADAHKQRFLYVWIALVCSSFWQCSVSKYLKENQFLLSKQSFKNNKDFGRSDLLPLLRQKPNRKFLGTQFYLYTYFEGKKRFDSLKIANERTLLITSYNKKLLALGDSSVLNADEGYLGAYLESDSALKTNVYKKQILKIRRKKARRLNKINKKLNNGNWLMRVVGEPPSIYDSAVSNENVAYIQSFMVKRGYFDSKVEYTRDTVGKYIKEKYFINEGIPYTINSVQYVSKDSSLKNLLEKNKKQILILAGNKYTEESLTSERDRIAKELKNFGYFDFSTQYIFFEIDSSGKSHKLDINVIIENPDNKNHHDLYKINQITVSTEQAYGKVLKDTVNYRNINFVYQKDNFSKKILWKKIKIGKGDVYDQSKIQLTQRQLALLDMYKFINVSFEKINLRDSTASLLNMYIRTSSLKKFQSTEEIGLSVASNFIPGPAGSLNFKSRNTFRGFEVFEVNLRATVVGQASFSNNDQFYRSEEYSAQSSLSFPQLFFPLPRGLKTLFENFSPSTKFSTSYTLVRRPEYRRSNINTNMTYNFYLTQRKFISFSIIDLNYVKTTDKSDDFNQFLETYRRRGNNLVNSFGQSIVTDINLSYTFNNNVIGENTNSKYFKLYIESGGTSLNFLNKTTLLKSTDTLFGLKTYRYYKVNLDYRSYIPVNRDRNTVAMRFNVGVAKAYDKEEVLPYERYFFIGGSNSMRAWRPRRLGPGSYAERDSSTGKVVYTYEQPGTLILETSLEYRFKIIKFIDGALFLDAGNTWIWKPRNREEKVKPEGVFEVDKFLSQIAIGNGFGLRFNFSFLILRFDFGLKVKDPVQPAGQRWVFLKQGYRSPLLNLSIGYPF